MDALRYQRIKHLAEALLDLDGDARAASLHAAGTEDPTLRLEVESLLSSMEQAEAHAFLAAPAAAADAAIAGTGTRGYRILREIGHGGMGTVYLAERADGEYRQQVALKTLNVEAGDNPLFAGRLRAERQILAQLQHPGIARLLDGGTDAAGRPFLAMEYVEGERIDRWCEARALPIAARIALFLKVCDAVQYAHQQLVVHRDIKPANILVDRLGEPRLLDFGIARLVDEGEATGTATADRMMTFRYASPEQIRGERVGTASDVYSLGVVLFRLLTGHLPYANEDAAAPELARAVLDDPPRSPSRSVTQGKSGDEGPEIDRLALARQLYGDIDAILLRALRKQPAERYASVAQFAEDLRRHLDGLPVMARQGQRGYALRKFLARHRWSVAAGLAALATLLAFTIAIAMQLERTRVERDKAQRTLQFTMRVFERADPRRSGGVDLSVKQAVALASADLGAPEALPPEERAALLHVLGSARFALGDFAAARQMIDEEVSLREALAAGDADHAAALLLRGGLEIEAGGVEAGERTLQAAEAMLARSVAPDDPRVIDSALRRATAYRRLSRSDQARSQFERARDLSLRRLGWDEVPATPVVSADRDSFLRLAAALHGLGVVAYDDGRYTEAEADLQRVLAMRRQLQSGNAPEIADTLSVLGNIHAAQGRFEAAVAVGRETLAVRRAAYGEGHTLVGQAMLNLANSLRALKRIDEASELNGKALEIFRRVHGDAHQYTQIALNNQAIIFTAQGEVERALDIHRTLYAQRRETLGAQHDDVAQSAINIGASLVRLGRAGEAIAPLREGLAIYATHYSPAALDGERVTLAEALRDAGQLALAEAELRSVHGHEGDPDAIPLVIALARFDLARLLAERDGISQQALDLAGAARAVARQSPDNEVIDLAEVESWLRDHRPP
jgi:eukaryotic-like serine/threonine-protein kinase